MERKHKRALRRHHRARMLERAYKCIKQTWYWYPSYDTHREKEIRDVARRRRDNMQACSCSGCGNPRRAFGYKNQLTVAELRAEDSYKSQLQEIYDP